ncbi:selection and upkeep of intraepithelial T-cells protein 1-like [Mauremys mutica]|uniref:selection and upkeep of intraepithelial T-cells protein 1-like n=1 Tax=Mauremys mutica TaxID=74926 RepID=UPI001D155994|nr:selection and upkeep of intraepithelial T-cells protein 1-like [Mauremys mutica]
MLGSSEACSLLPAAPWHCHCITLTRHLVCYFSCSPDPAMMMGKVPSFSPGSTVSSALPGYVALCLALQVQRLVSAQFTVTGPDRPITASVSGEAVLPCHLSPRMSAQSMEVRWVRSQDSAVVHLYQNGQDQYENQMLDYQGRRELLKDDITSGSVSLRIRDIRPSDEGLTLVYFNHLPFFKAPQCSCRWKAWALALTSLWRDIRTEGSRWCVVHPDGTHSPRLSGEIYRGRSYHQPLKTYPKQPVACFKQRLPLL